MTRSKYILQYNFLCAFLFVSLINAIGQTEAKFERLTRNEGLSHNNVTSILQDRYGFMWFATREGLNRFDGFNFKQYFNEPVNSKSIASGNITSIFESKSGYLWIGTYSGGLDQYHPLKNEFKHFVFDENNDNGLGSNSIRQIKEDQNGNLWIATIGGGLNYFDIKSETFTKYFHRTNSISSISSNDVYSIEIDSIGNLWIGTGSSLDYFDIDKGQFSHYVIGYESFDQTKPLTIKSLAMGRDKKLWIGTSNGLFTYDTRNNVFNQYRHNFSDANSISNNNINTIFPDSYNTIWIGTENGLSKFLPEINGFQNFYTNMLDISSISSNKVLYIYEDRSNILWIGTKGGGINKLDLKQKKFLSIRHLFNHQSGKNHPGINTIFGDTAGNIWMGADGGGVSVFNRKKSSIENPGQKFSSQAFLSDDQILSAIKVDQKTFFGMQTGGLNILQKNNGRYIVEKYLKTGDSRGIANNQVNCLLMDKDGFLWIGTRDGLNKMIDTAKNGNKYFISYRTDFNNKNTISSNDISAIYQDHKGFIWIGTNGNGINRLNELTGKIELFSTNPQNSATIGSNSINSIFEDHLGIIWIGTSGGGINMLNADNRSFSRFTVKDGLPSNDIMAMLEDHNGFLWIATSKGLSKFDPISKEFTNFDIKDGLLNDGFNPSSAFQDDFGWMYFGTSSGLVYFNPSQIQLNPHKPDIVISKFTFLKDKEWSSNELFISKYNSEDSKLVLDYVNNIFSIEFVAMDFTSPDENQFQYKIEGINDSWIEYGNKRSMMVANLEPGNYTLKIRGTNNDNILNEEGLSLSIIVKPPFWKRNEFYVLIFVIFGMVFIAIYSFLIKHRTNKLLAAKNYELELTNARLQESEKSLMELNNTKDKFFSIIAHDLRNPFNPLLALTELLDNDYDELHEKERIGFIKEIRIGAKKLYDLLENLLNWALSQTKQISFNPKPIDLNELILSVIDLMKINAEKKGIFISSEIPAEAIVFADENMLNSTIRNLLNNAIKFSDENTQVRINVFNEEASYKIEIKDHGSGISPEYLSSIFKGLSSKSMHNSKGKGSGLGLILCKEFVERNGGEIWVESKQGAGSSFFFTVNKA